MIDSCIKRLVLYALDEGLLQKEDIIYTTNLILGELKKDTYEEPETAGKIESPKDLEETLGELLDYAAQQGLLEDNTTDYRDLFDTKIMNLLLPRPGEVIRRFWKEYEKTPEAATDYYYRFSQASDYIRTYRIEKDVRWAAQTEYGDIDITINLSKPEKDPKMIALAKSLPASSYPKCLLCVENEGYAGRINHPARQNHRIIPITINEQEWGFQYSPYVYYNEHCIVFHSQHVPMKLGRETFTKLFDFIDLFPHYFLGSNADLPIVGGSILSHDHYQGGRYTFAMEKAPVEREITLKSYPELRAGIVKWPMSVIRLSGESRGMLEEAAFRILEDWRIYSDEGAYIFAETNGEPHNTVTPIARKRGGRYELDLVLRNNITTPEHPFGLYHPWEEYHNIKKENIGLIEVMGLAVLPARLKAELETLADALINGKDIEADEEIRKHKHWVDSFLGNYPDINAGNVREILRTEVGNVFLQVLQCAGVFKRDDAGQQAFLRFIDYLNR